MTHQEWLDILHLIYQAHRDCSSPVEKAVHASMGTLLSIQQQTLFRGKTLTELRSRDFLVPGGQRGSGIRAILAAVLAGRPLPEHLQIFPPYVQGCMGGVNVQKWDLKSTVNQETCPLYWVHSSVMAYFDAGFPLEVYLMPRRGTRPGEATFVDSPMPLEAFCAYMPELPGVGDKHYNGNSLRHGRARDLLRQGVSIGQVRCLLGHASYSSREDDMRRCSLQCMRKLRDLRSLRRSDCATWVLLHRVACGWEGISRWLPTLSVCIAT